MAKKAPPSVYFDEHIHPGVIDAFRKLGYRCLLISRVKKFSGKDERTYIGQLRSKGAFFVTGDSEFIGDVIKDAIKHSGIILVPTGWYDDTLAFAASGMAGFILGYIDRLGRRFLYDKILSIADDGYHVIVKGVDKLKYSVDRIEIDMNL